MVRKFLRLLKFLRYLVFYHFLAFILSYIMDFTCLIQLFYRDDHIITITDPVAHICKDTISDKFRILYISDMLITSGDDVVE